MNTQLLTPPSQDGLHNDEAVEGVRPEDLSLGRFLRAAATRDWSDAIEEKKFLEERDLALGAATFNWPEAVADQFFSDLVDQTALGRLGVTMLSMDSHRQKIPVTSTSPAVVYKVENNAPLPDVTMDMVGRTAIAHTAACTISCSREVVQDGVNFEAQVQRAIVLALLWSMDQKAISGTGTGEPLGVQVSGDVPTIAVTGPLTYDAIIDGYAAVANERKPPTGVLMSATNWAALHKIKSATGGQYLHPRIGGLEVATPNALDTVATVGHWPDLAISIRSFGVEIAADADGWATNSYTFRGVLRYDSTVARLNSFVNLTGLT